MTRSEKTENIELLKDKFSQFDYFYVTDASGLSVGEVNNLRAKCFEQGIEMKVVKNTFAIKALEAGAEEKGYSEIFDFFKGPTALMFTESASSPAKLINEFRKSHQKPVLKAAYIETAVYVGDEELKALSELKSKEELVGEIIALLQSPMKNVVGALKSSGSTIAGLVKALEERAS